MTNRQANALVLDDQLCFALYAASRAMTARYRPMLDDVGLTYPQYLVLVALADDGSGTVSSLGRRLRLDSGTLSPLLTRLETRGLVSRTRRTDDERSVDIALTAAGKQLASQVTGFPDRIAGALDDLDQDRLRDDLRRLTDLLYA